MATEKDPDYDDLAGAIQDATAESRLAVNKEAEGTIFEGLSPFQTMKKFIELHGDADYKAITRQQFPKASDQDIEMVINSTDEASFQANHLKMVRRSIF